MTVRKRNKSGKVILITLFLLVVLMAFPPTVQAAVYPASVETTEESGYYKIIKSYALSPAENPEEIPKEPFEKAGIRYVFSDILKKEQTTEDSQEHTEIITISTSSQNINDILSQLAPTLAYDKDGYTGELELNLTTVQTAETGRKTSSYEVTKTREYPHLSGNDTSLVPKSIEEGGKTYTLADVNFTEQNTNSIDYEEVASSYKAVAKYTATASSTKVTGYTTTAEYKGVISKSVTDKIFYSVIFMGEEIVKETPKPIETEKPTPEPAPIELPKEPINYDFLSLIGMVIVGFLIGGGATAAYFLLEKNTVVYNKKDGKYIVIGKIKINTKKPIADLKRFTKKAYSAKYILELSNRVFTKLKNKEVAVKYGEETVIHKIDGESDMEKYQFEANFTDTVKKDEGGKTT